MDKKISILWISLNAPTKKADKAGGNTFNYYFSKFYNDERFDVKVIAQINNSLPLMELKEGDYFYLKREPGLKHKLKKLSSIESKYNPWNRNANLLSNQMETFVHDRINELLSAGFKPEIVILEWTQCVVLARKIRKWLPESRIVASEHDVTFIGYERKAEYYTGFKRAVWNQKAKHEKKVEVESLKACDLILPQNSDNIDILRKDGVEGPEIQCLTPYFNSMVCCPRVPNGKDILFFGAMNREENYLTAQWFIENVMPRLKDMDIRFIVLGGNPPQELKALECDQIHITGFVDAIEPYFESAVCFVAPLVLGAGIKVKILEALSSGIPVLTNDIGIEGIPAKKNVEYIHCSSAEEYEKSIRNVFEHGEWAQQIGEKAKDFISEQYSLEKSLNQYREWLLKAGEAK